MRTKMEKEEEDIQYDGSATHWLWVGFGLCGFDMEMRHHGLKTLFVFR